MASTLSSSNSLSSRPYFSKISMYPAITVAGVLSSCDASETNFCCLKIPPCNLSSILFKVFASSVSSSFEGGIGILPSILPKAIPLARLVIVFIGSRVFLLMTLPIFTANKTPKISRNSKKSSSCSKT